MKHTIITVATVVLATFAIVGMLHGRGYITKKIMSDEIPTKVIK